MTTAIANDAVRSPMLEVFEPRNSAIIGVRFGCCAARAEICVWLNCVVLLRLKVQTWDVVIQWREECVYHLFVLILNILHSKACV